MQKAVIFAMARTGSTLLQTMLACHPDVHFHGEIYGNKAWVNLPSIKPILNSVGVDLTAWRDQDHLRFFDWVFAQSPKKPVVGFKMFLSHSPVVIDKLIADTDIKLIILDRENRLASFSSHQIGKVTNSWRTNDDESTTRLLTFDPVAFRKHCRFVDRRYAALKKRLVGRPNVLSTTYNEVVARTCTNSLLSFLGLPEDVALTSKLKKQNPSQPRDRFANPSAVDAHLSKIRKQDWALHG